MESKKPSSRNRRALAAVLSRDGALFLKRLPAAIALALLFAGICVLAGGAMEQGTQSPYEAAKVAIIDEDGSLVSTMAIGAVSGQSFAAPLDIRRATRKKAMTGIRDGSFSAVIVLPKGYSDRVMSGQKVSAKIILSNGAQLHGDIIRKLADFGEKLLAAGQAGVFAGESISLDLYPDDHDEYLKLVNTRYIDEAATAASRYFTVETTNYADTDVTAQSYYALIYLTLFMQLCALFFLPLHADCSTGMLRRLRTLGVSRSAFLSGKLLFPLLFRVAAAAAAAAWFAARVGAVLTPVSLLCLLAALALATLVASALLLCLPDNGAGELLLTAVAALGLFTVGGLIPRSDLSAAVTAFGAFTPTGLALSLSMPLFGGSVRPAVWLAAAGMAGLCLLWLYRHLAALERGEGELQ